MAYNNSGYPYQYQDRSGWVPAYAQDQDQRGPQGQSLPHYQHIPPELQQQSYEYRMPSQQVMSNPAQSPHQGQLHQQQYQQYRQMQSPDMHYVSRMPQYDGSASPYGQSRQTHSPSNQQYPYVTPQQQHKQYAMAPNRQIASIPQRQLSYSHPQQHQMSSPQISSNVMPPSPQFSMQSYSAQVQHGFDQPLNFTANTQHQMARQMQSQSPVIQGQRSSSMSLSEQHSRSRQFQSQSPIVPSHPSDQVPSRYGQSNTMQPAQSKVKGLSAQNVQTNAQFVSHEFGKSVQTKPTQSPPVNLNNQNPQTMEKESSTEPLNTQLRNASINQTFSPKPAVSKLQSIPRQTSQSTAIQKDSPRIKTELVGESMKPMSKPKEQLHAYIDATLKQEPLTAIKSEAIESISKAVTEIDYALLLIDLAEEYFDAAYGIPIQGRPAKREPDLQVFYKLIATGLGCLEVVLKQWRSTLQPAVEAAIRLRYASILFAETTNTSEAEEVLSKGISQCDKLRLINFKYNMHHLLARVTFTTNPKAAIKYVASVIKDAEIQNHTPWIYAFRFLSASLSLQMQQSQETLQALGQLKIVLNVAKLRGDIEVAAMASAIEAMTHINRANNVEAIEQAQTALATVRSAENNPNVSKIPQLIIMAYFVDLMCSLFRADSDTAYKKMKAMHEAMDNLADHNGWTIDNEIMIPISQQSAKSMPGGSADGVVISQQAERTYLKMAWMPKNELYALGNMLGAATVMHKASSDKKCEELLGNAKAFLHVASATNSSIPDLKRHEDLACHLQILRVFASCSKNAWGDAKKELNSLKVKMAGMDDSMKISLPAFIIYLEAMIAQGTGDTSTALVLYNNPMLALTKDGDLMTRRSPIINDLSILATLNTILIIHRPNHPQHHRMDSLISALESLDTTNPSGNMRGAYYLIRALRSDASTDPTTNPILNTKNNLREVLQIAKQTGNSQFSCISLTFMTDRFFTGQVGEQAHKSASTALNLARRGKNDLWTSVAEGLLAACLETRGDSVEAEMRRKEALQLAMRLPPSMQVADEGGGR